MAMTAESLRGPLRFTIDLTSGLIQQPIRPQLMKGDKRANTIIVELTEDKKPADLSGVAVTGSFISPMDGAEIPLEGSVNGSEARVTLPDECYAAEGYFEANVKLTMGDTSRTILSITGHVLSKGSGVVIDIGNVIPNIDDIIAQYAQMKSVTQETQAAANAANAAAGRAPYIDGGTWRVWDAAAGVYKDTGIPATGPQGPKGDPGAVQSATASGQTFLPNASGVLDLSGMKAADSNKLGGRAPEYYTRPLNLLDNSNFEIAQAGYPEKDSNGVWISGLHGSTLYFADRWFGSPTFAFSKEGPIKTLTSTSSYSWCRQTLWNDERDRGKTYTLAVTLADDTVVVGSGTVPNRDLTGNYIVVEKHWNSNGDCSILLYKNQDGTLWARFNAHATGSTISFKHIVLYEGAYTAETLPPYVPKGYAAELAECKRYYNRVTHGVISGVTTTEGTASAFVPLPQEMRITYPTIKAPTTLWGYTHTGNAYGLTYKGCINDTNGILIQFTCNSTTRYPINIPNVSLEISADMPIT